MESYEERTKDYADKIAAFQVKQKQPYEFKRKYAEIRINEFIRECGKRDLNCHVSVGGLDSITLLVLIRSMGYTASDVPGVSISALEDSSVQLVHRALGVERLKPYKNKVDILQEFGFPVISKEVAAKIELLANPSEKNKTVRHAIITGETGEYGGYRKGTRMKLADRWLQLFGGYANEEEGCNYGIPPEGVKVSSQCCYWLKEKPADDWAKEHHSAPFLGLMASEGGRRQKSLMINGCNYFGKSTTRSAPFAIYMRQDILTLALEMDKYYREHIDDFAKAAKLRPNENMPESIIPAVYGEIKRDFSGKLRTTKAQRTGCSMCGFGIHMEKRPHRFDRLRERNPKEWEFWMYRCCKDADGTPFGWGRVLDYIGVGWQDEVFDMDNSQLSFDDIQEEEK